MDAPIDFFISYTSKDKAWAEWVAWTLKEAGYQILFQGWDFHASSNFILKMQQGLTGETRTVAVISPNYFKSDNCNAEWSAAYAKDPASKNGKLITIRIEDFHPEGLLEPKVYIDLFNKDQEVAKETLLDSIASTIAGKPMKPAIPPAFPGGKSSATSVTPPPFPGAPTAKKSFLNNLPFSPNPFFTDPHKLMDKLHTALCKKTAAAITQPQAVHGLGGVGKTQLATEYAWQHKDEYDCALWVGVASPAELHANLARLADVMELPEAVATKQEDKVAAVLKWLRTHERWLLILDNADTKEAKEAVQKILPVELHGHVIVTSRRLNWPNRFADLEVEMLPADAAAEFLQRRSAKSGFIAGNKTEAESVANELGCLPLALEQAGAYIDRHHKSFPAYLGLLKESRARILAEASAGGTDYPKSVAETWLVSEAQLSPVARVILQIAAFLAPEEIPQAMFTNGGELIDGAVKLLAQDKSSEAAMPPDTAAIEDAMVELAELSLVELETDAFSCHRLLQAVLLDRLKPDERRIWGKLAVHLVNAYAPQPSDDVRTWPDWNRLQPHADTLLKNVDAAADDAAAALMNEFALLLKAKALFTEAEPLLRRSLAITEKSFGSEHPDVASCLNNLAALLKDTNRLAEAEPLMRRALAITEKSFDPEHPKVATRLNNLAGLLQATNRLAEAEPLMRRSLAIIEKSFDPEHSAVATRLNNLAGLLQATNRLAEAEPLMRRALAIDEKSFGLEHPKVATRLNNLAQLLKDTNRLTEAEPLMRRALAIDEKSLGPEHPDVAVYLNNLASLLKATNRLTEAEPLIRRALAMDEKSFGPEHPKVANRLSNLAGLLHATNRLAEAEPLMRRAAGICIRSLGLEHPNTKLVLNNYKVILSNMKLPPPVIKAKLRALTGK